MNRTCIAVATLALATQLAVAQTTVEMAAIPASVHGRQLDTLIKSAHTGVEYKRLAAYFHERETIYRDKAAAEKIERDRRAQVNAGLMYKYPRPVDQAQYFYQTYLTEADQAAAQAQRYDRLATNAQAQPDGQVAAAPQPTL